ncbi:hypothetical protein SAMD00023520_00001 [Listeria monocytogenes]|nr:hypothetical protein SAMD00023520_00001 [Listeria monocytogenes]
MWKGSSFKSWRTFTSLSASTYKDCVFSRTGVSVSVS